MRINYYNYYNIAMQLDVQSYTSEMNIQDMLSKLDQVEDSTQSLS